MRSDERVSANEMLLDRQIFDVDGEPVGKIDDLEFAEPDGGGPPVLTAFLSGPTALGPRIGGRIGLWWGAFGRRLRPADDPYPNRIPLNKVDEVDRTKVTLRVSRDELDADRFRDWTRDHIIGRIPGSQR
jgi:hypothetical protein